MIGGTAAPGWKYRTRALGTHVTYRFTVEVWTDTILQDGRADTSGATWQDISSRMFGRLADGSQVERLPNIGVGSERGDTGAIATQGASVTVWNGDGWWNGRANANIAENVVPFVDEEVGAGNKADLASNGDTTGIKGSWKSDIAAGQDHYIGFQTANAARLVAVHPFKVTEMHVWFPTDFNPDSVGELVVQTIDANGDWADVTLTWASCTGITRIGATDEFYTTATAITLVFPVETTTGIRLKQNAAEGHSSNPNQMAVTEIRLVGTYNMPRTDMGTWKDRYIRVREYQKDSALGTFAPKTVNTYLIDDITYSGDSATLKLIDVGIKLRRFDAEKVRDGEAPWQNRNVPFLMREILTGAFPSTDVDGWTANIPDGPIQLDLADTSQRVASSFGPATSWKTVGSIETWGDVDPGYVIEAMYLHSNGKLYLGMSAYHDTSLAATIFEYDPATFTMDDKAIGLGYTSCNVWMIDYSSSQTKLFAVFGDDAPADTTRTCDIYIATATAGSNFAEVYDTTTDEAAAYADKIAPCNFVYRDGGTVGTYYRGIGHCSYTPDDYFGENLTIPFAQYLRYANGSPENTDDAVAAPRGSIDGEHTEMELGNFHNGAYYEHGAAYRTWTDDDTTDGDAQYPIAFNVKHSLGSRRAITFQDDRIFFVTYDGTDEYHIAYYDFSADGITELGNDATWNDSTRQPTCLMVNSGAIYAGLIDWDDSNQATHVPSVAYLKQYNAAGTEVGSKTFDTGDEMYMVPIAIAPADAATNNGVVGCILIRDDDTDGDTALNGKIYGPKYAPFYIASNMAGFVHSGEVDGGFESSMPLLGWTDNGAAGSANSRTYFVDTATGFTYYYEGSGGDIVRCNAIGGPAVESEYDIATQFLAIDYDATIADEIVYGVSAPRTPKNTLEYPAPGRYELWQLANTYNYTIPLADFEGLNGWEALSHLLVPIDYTRKFDEDANFEAAARVTAVPDPTYTIVDSRQAFDASPDASTGYILNIGAKMTMLPGYDQVANYAAIKPSTISLGPVEGRGTFTERPEGVADFASELVCNQAGTAAHSIVLECVQQGQPRAQNYVAAPQCRFRGYVYKYEINTVLTADASTSSYDINLRDIGNEGMTVAPGDFVQLGDDDLNRVNPAYGSVVLADNYVTVTLTSYPSEAYPAETSVTIWKQDHMQPTDSEYGVTTIFDDGTGYTAGDGIIKVNSAARISLNQILTASSSNGYTEFLVTGIEDKTTYWEITVTEGICRTTDVNHPENTVLRGYFAPASTKQQYEIFGTGITLGIYPPDDGDDSDDTIEQHKTFFIGDKIKIEAKGLVLEEQAQSLLEAEAVPSQNIYGKQEYKGGEVRYNRFMGFILGTEIVKRVRTAEKYPKRRFSCDLQRYFRGIEPLDVVYVKSQLLLPAETSNRVACEVLNVKHTLPANGMSGNTVIELRATTGAIL